ESRKRLDVLHALERQLDLPAHGGDRVVRQRGELRDRRPVPGVAQLARGGLTPDGIGTLEIVDKGLDGNLSSFRNERSAAWCAHENRDSECGQLHQLMA